MKTFIIFVLTISTLSFAYCEHGYQQNREIVHGGCYVTYSFSNSRNVGIKFSYSEIIPYSIRFDFDKMEICN